jgi:alpha-galactosidase
MLAAPLMCGNDLMNMTVETRNILINNEVIAIDQDSLGIQGFRYAVSDSVETWLKPLSNDEWVITFLNRSKTTKSVIHDWKTFSVNDEFSQRKLDTSGKDVFLIRDLWLKKNIGDTRKILKAEIPACDVLCLKLSLKQVKSKK